MATFQPGAPSLPSPDSTALSGWLSRHRLLAFFVLAFGLTWPFMIADALGSSGLFPFRLTFEGSGIILVLLMSFGPTFATLVITGATNGRAGIAALLRRLLIWRVGIQWYAAAILGTGLIFFTASQLYLAFGGTLRALPPASLLELVLLWLVSFVVHGLLNGEELGWRGVALPQLLARYNALTASLILGVIWTLFHLPIFFTQPGDRRPAIKSPRCSRSKSDWTVRSESLRGSLV